MPVSYTHLDVYKRQGVHHEADYTNLTADTVAVSGVGLFAENISGVVVSTIAAPAVTPVGE